MKQEGKNLKYEQFYKDVFKLWSITGRNKELWMRKYKFSMPEIRIFYMLSENGELKTSDIAETMCNSTSAVTQIIDQLVDKKFIKRETSKDDRRKIILGITKLGEKRFDEFKAEHLKIMGQYLSKLDEHELDTIIKLMSKIIN